MSAALARSSGGKLAIMLPSRFLQRSAQALVQRHEGLQSFLRRKRNIQLREHNVVAEESLDKLCQHIITQITVVSESWELKEGRQH
jgi:hypothetical protein